MIQQKAGSSGKNASRNFIDEKCSFGHPTNTSGVALLRKMATEISIKNFGLLYLYSENKNSEKIVYN